MNAADKAKIMAACGFVIGARDTRLNRNYAGAFMVAEPYTDGETPTDNGENGPWCIVGDSLDALIEEAFANWGADCEDALEEQSRLAAIHRA